MSQFLFSIALLPILLFFQVECQKLCDRKYLNNNIRIDEKVVIVTGGSSGLGLETAKNLATRGGKIYIASSGVEKGLKAVEEIKATSGNEKVKFIRLDLGSLDSVRNFASEFIKLESRLDILIDNAGVVAHYNKTKDGFELNMGINHLGHFLLTNLLLDLLKASAPSRIIIVSSIAHYIGLIIPNNFNSELFFPGFFKAYANSKLAQTIFGFELARRLQGTGVTVNSCDPGPSVSSIADNVHPILQFFFVPFQQFFWRPPEHGAQSHIMLAVDPSVENVTGKYFFDCMEKEPSILAKSDKLAFWLWNHSEKLTSLN